MQFDAHHSAPQLLVEKLYSPHRPGTTQELCVDNFKSQLFRSGFVDTAMKSNKPRTALELIVAYCKRSNGRIPYLSTQYQSGGWCCIVKINNTQGCEALRYQTEELSVQAAVTKACEVFIPPLIAETLTSIDPYSNKEVVPLVDKSEWKEVAFSSVASRSSTSVPYITISSDNLVSSRTELPARSVSDSLISKHTALGVEDVSEHLPSGPSDDSKKHRRAFTINGAQLSAHLQEYEWTLGDDQHFVQPHARPVSGRLLNDAPTAQDTANGTGQDPTANEQAAVTLEDVERISDALGSAEGAVIMMDMIKESARKLCPICKTKPWNVTDDRLLLNHADRCLQVHLLTGRT